MEQLSLQLFQSVRVSVAFVFTGQKVEITYHLSEGCYQKNISKENNSSGASFHDFYT